MSVRRRDFVVSRVTAGDRSANCQWNLYRQTVDTNAQFTAPLRHSRWCWLVIRAEREYRVHAAQDDVPVAGGWAGRILCACVRADAKRHDVARRDSIRQRPGAAEASAARDPERWLV